MNLFAFSSLLTASMIYLYGDGQVIAQALEIEEASQELDVDPNLIENSPIIQKWIEKIPDVSEKVRHQPSFRTLIRFGYSQFPSNNQSSGVFIGVEDIFLGNTPLTFSAEYTTNINNNSNSKNNRLSVGGNLKYYLLPLGNYVNIAPSLGYQYIETSNYQKDGINIGLKLILAFSPQGAADISLSQNFIAPTSSEEVGITEIKAGYALSKKIRLSLGIAWQNSIKNTDSQVNIGFEWMP